jgi:Protein of unknown function (DUF2892)
MATASFFARNEGNVDRIARVALGLALLFVAFTGRGAWGYLGFIPLLTGALGTCPLYSIMGINTCPVKR